MEVKGTVAHLLGLSKLPGRQAQLPPPGAKVTATVQRYLGKGIWLLDLDGTRVEARSRLSLVPGQRLHATVEREGGALLLITRSRSSDTLSSMLRSSGIQESALGRTVISLLFSAGAPARSDLMERLAAALRRRQEGRGGRLEAESLVRGFRELPDELAALIPPISGIGGDRDGSSEKEAGEGSEEENGSPAERLRRALFRSVPVGDHPIQLYNHRARFGSGWIALPLGFFASETRGGPESHFQGVLHIATPDSSAPRGSWTLDLCGKELRYTLAYRGSKGLQLRVNGGNGGNAKKEGAAQQEALARLLTAEGYAVEISESPFDGIEFKDHSDLQEGIDLLQ